MGEDREHTTMTQRAQWPVRLASRLLDLDEREVVLGDIAESHAGNGRAVCDILGLAARRQVAAWGDWRPWLALVYVALPLGILLGIVSRFWADDTVETIRLYVTNWNGPLFRNPGGRQYLIELTNAALLDCAALVVWSWTCGMAFVVLSRRTSCVNGIFFVACLVAATAGTTTTARDNTLNAAIFEQATYGVVLPLFIRAATVILPAALGLMFGRRPRSLGRITLWTVAAIAFTLLTFRGLESSLFFGWIVRTPRDVGWVTAPVLRGQWLPGPDGFIVSADDVIGWRLRALPLLTLLPVAFMITFAAWGRRPDLVTP